MKKIIAILLTAALAASFTACGSGSTSSASSTVESSSESSVSSAINSESSSASSEVSSEASSDVSSDTSSEESTPPIDGEKLPDVEGSEAFQAAFKDNAIDTAYLKTINSSDSVVALVRAGNNGSNQWQAMIDSTYNELLEKITDSEKLDTLKSEQSSWENSLSTEISKVKANVTSTGSLVNVEIAYGTMLIYRERAAALLAELFDITGTVDIASPSSEAAG